ncbi:MULTISPECIES: DUF3017 domain-containing protein [unclassified Nocardioides]|uniref:DUF3017 domain-containing protein n=1 Tax=unclassified Nocardioides TaxID=2615069 RepID=UPI0006F69C96|nr:MULTISPECIES: DUF3017 domain-containing protein [unclassified Nocardioides]KQY64706.1 hypothetical protein ASD30_07360 [Nocardioides sp. Root140]KRF12609.1 hypothetical protein ASH02_13715 [Nocardioides sp. Soil796]
MAEQPEDVSPQEDPAGQPAAEPAGPVADPAADPVAGPVAEPPAPRAVTEIKKPSTLGGIIYLVALAGALIGVVVAATGSWRSGVSWLALSLLVAAGARLALNDDDAGMLRVRRKGLDATILVVMAVSLLVLVASIPDQPG